MAYNLSRSVDSYKTSEDILAEVAKALKGKSEPPMLTVRQFLNWFDAQRRGPNIVAWINELMSNAGLQTSPPYTETYIDDEIRIILIDPKTSDITEQTTGEPPKKTDPVLRIGSLKSGKAAPVTVSPTDTLSQAITLMMANDYSQLPVITGPRDIKGVISWKTIGERLASGASGTEVRFYMTPAHIVRHDAPFFTSIPGIIESEYVLVRGSDSSLSSIVTTTDLSDQFLQLTEPFLVLNEIENHVRGLIQVWAPDLSAEKLSKTISLPENYRDIFDLSFGDYVRILQSEVIPEPFPLNIHRAEFCKLIDQIRETRNDVMHFSADPTPPEAIARLRKASEYLRKLQALAE